MRIINNQYRSICRPSTLITRRSKCVNTFFNDFLRNFVALFNNGSFKSIEIYYPLVALHISIQESPDPKIYQIQISTRRWPVMRLQ